MENNKTILFIGGIALIFWLAFSKLRQVGQDIQDYAADTFVGQMVGLTTNEGTKAKEFLTKTLWLNHNYYNWLTDHFNVTNYNFSMLPVEVVNDIVNDIIDSNYVIFDQSTLDRILQFGLQFSPVQLPPDKPAQCVAAFNRVSNQIQALQVVDRYYTITQKNLGSALAHWLPNDYMVQVWNHLKDFRTGVFKKNANGTSGAELSQLPKP